MELTPGYASSQRWHAQHLLAMGRFREGRLEAFEDTGGAHAAADAHGDEAVVAVAALQFAKDGCGELRTGAAQGMAEGHGAAIDVDARGVESRDFDDGKRLRGEGFVQFNHINLLELQTR